MMCLNLMLDEKLNHSGFEMMMDDIDMSIFSDKVIAKVGSSVRQAILDAR